MTAQDPSNSHSLRRVRHLVFDVLEDRRLLAGLDVYVFDDADVSRTFDSLRDGPVSDRAVYIDLNNDGKFSSPEPWAVSNDRGMASFTSLEPGSYSVRLLGSNKSIQQTFPTRPSDEGFWADGLNVSKVVRVETNGQVWGIAGNSISLINISTNQIIKSIRFGSTAVIDAVLKPSVEGELSGYVLTQSQDQLQVLWQVSTVGNGTKRAVNVDLLAGSQLFTVGDRLLLVHGIASKEISSFDLASGSNAFVLQSTGVKGLSADSMVKPSGDNGFIVYSTFTSEEENAGETVESKLSLYKLDGGTGMMVGERSFSSEVTEWEASNDGASIAVSTPDGFFVLRTESGLPIRKILSGAAAPIAFDPVRNLLLSGATSSRTKVIGWNTADWSERLSVPISEARVLLEGTSKLSLDASGSQLVASQNGALYQHNIAAAASTSLTITGNEQKQIQIGVRSTGANLKPSLGKLDNFDVNEDGQLIFDSSTVQARTKDSDGDEVVYVVRSGPAHGALTWNQDASGSYQPIADLNGQDAISIQAYDGRDWSTVQVLGIAIHAVNDLPTDIVFSDDLIPENPKLQTSLSTFAVVDVDTDAKYYFVVDDDRFGIADGVLRLLKGTLNFEEQPLIVLAVTGFERSRPQDSITRKVTLRIQDVNDAPTGISAPGSISVPELTEDLKLGHFSIVDQDVGEVYEWSVSDSRFSVKSGVLQLAPDQMLDFESEPSIDLVVRARDSRGEFAIEKSVTVFVTDQDDEPTGVVINSSSNIRENESGVTVGRVSVLDPDQGELYAFSVNDNRFEVLSGGAVRLRPGASVSYVEPGFIDLTIFASSLRSGSRISGSLRLFVEKDPTPHHNDRNPYDVDGDGVLTPLDPLIIINHINNNGVGPIEEPGEGEDSLPDLDVDGDGEVTPIDILILINKLNQETDDQPLYAFGKGEGEGMLVEETLLIPQMDVALTPSARKEVQAPGNLRDVSLASYLSELSDDIGPRKLRRR